jgi:hypothetical protein
LYLSGLYTRQEMALRIGIFYTAASLSGAFGGELTALGHWQKMANMWKGLLARGLSAIGPRGGLEGWRWIFIIEGLIVGCISEDLKVSTDWSRLWLLGSLHTSFSQQTSSRHHF